MGVVLRAMVGRYALGRATEIATEVEKLMVRTEGSLVVTAVKAAGVVGPYGVGAMLCCTGLALVFLSAATGVALGTRVTVLMAKARWNPYVILVMVGLVIALGAVAGGAGLGAAVGVVTGEVLSKIFCLVVLCTEIAILLALAILSPPYATANCLSTFLELNALQHVPVYMVFHSGIAPISLVENEERVDERIVFGLYQSCGNRRIVGRVFGFRWCGW